MDSRHTVSSDSAPPSTPPPAIFSDDANRPSSPPSSPPGFPWEYDAPKPTPQPPRRTAFSVLGKRKALSSISDNVRSAKKRVDTSKKAEKDGLTQMQISLGQKVQKRCKTCGMEYVASSAEDRKLHDKYHKQNTEGYDVGRDFVGAAREGMALEGVEKGDVVCVVDFKDKAARRFKTQVVLEIVQRALGAVEIDAGDLWRVGDWTNDEEPKYRHYLYVRGTRCIGYLLTERIHEAREVKAPGRREALSLKTEDCSANENGSNSATSALRKRLQTATDELVLAERSPILLSDTATTAFLGISRIWTSSAHRRQNIATALLDVACVKNGTSDEPPNTPKDMIAFSQPTASGAKLARKWFGKTFGWKVYVD